MFAKDAMVSDIKVAIEEMYDANIKEIEKLQSQIAVLKSANKSMLKQLQVLDELTGDGWIYAKPEKRVTKSPEEMREWIGPGHDPSGNQY